MIEPDHIATLVQTYTKDLLSHLEAYTRETVEHLILALVAYILLCILLFLCTSRWTGLFARDVRPARRVLLVTAHPDDECMFFGPSVVRFTSDPKCKVYLVCLSTGRNYGLGKIRKEELYKSCAVLGIEQGCVTVCNYTDLPDLMGAKWPIETVSKVILQQVECYSIDTLVTFDRHGVSYHMNHMSIYYAVAHLVLEKKIPTYCNVYVLETVNLIRKYWLILDIPVSFLLSRTRFIASRSLIRKAMQQHRSQLVWFRRLYTLFSRYMLINTLQLMELSDIELDLEIDD